MPWGSHTQKIEEALVVADDEVGTQGTQDRDVERPWGNHGAVLWSSTVGQVYPAGPGIWLLMTV